ncbi:hypothetical protein [Francisella sp. SYW-9]|uniref:hypothetical protein n=1 Tax=Francisella sp. SYW-9 TaxID=2610888 RepID=UPI00123CC4AF|nr:hypothetical protein [Francisella sp. SYW-9]
MEDYMKEQNNNTGLSQDSLINLFLHTATKEDLASHKAEVDRRFNEIDRRFNETNKHIDDLKADMNRKFDKIERLFYFIGGLVVTSIIVPIVLPLIKVNL